MATVTKTFNHEETQRRVRHPLQVLRKFIRRYVFLEGVALTLLCLTGLFWLGLAFDFGLYKFAFDLRGKTFFHLFDLPPLHVHGIDWIQELDDVDASGFSSGGVRVILLAAAVIGLLALGITKVALRWVREFNDRALALVLERRFQKELGDRLITAVELADPKLSKKYGYSQAMVEKTILEAVKTLERLPVADVFNWGRLVRLWALLGFSTIGVWLILMVVVSLGSLFSISPYGFAWRSYDVASIWTERNVFMMSSYWPRHAYLEIGRFQPSRDNPSEMRIPRDDVNDRPELQVRAIEWVVADRNEPQGWRALKWSDLPRFIDKDLLASVTIDKNFPDWLIDPDELEPNLAAALFGTDTQARTSGKIRSHLEKPQVREKISLRGAQPTLDKWLDWREWTVDKMALQKDETAVRIPLRVPNNTRWGDNYESIDAIFARLEELAEAPSMSRTLRKLNLPGDVDVSFRGEEKSKFTTVERGKGNRFPVPLDLLTDSTRFRFRVRGDDFFTAPKDIVLVPAPAPASITIDKEEPAYIAHRLHGGDQSPLAGKRHFTRDYPLSTTGDTNTIEVPLGTDLVIHVQIDRKLHGEKPVVALEPPVLEAGYDTFRGKIAADDQNKVPGGFSIHMPDLTRKHDFVVEFFDEDNIRGKRRFKILSVIDAEPQLSNLSVLGYNPRKPKVKTAASFGKDKERDPRDLREHAEISGAFLITPEALIPFECMVKDDYGLVRVGYQYKLRKVDFELMSQGGKNLPTLEINPVSQRLHASLTVSGLQFWPGNPLAWHMGPEYVALMADLVQSDLRQEQGYKEAFVPAEGFQELLNRKSGKMMHPAGLQDFLAKRRAAQEKEKLEEYRRKKRLAQEKKADKQEVEPALAQYLAENDPYYSEYNPQPWEFDFKDDRDEAGNLGFDVRRLLPALRAVDPEKTAQFHYLLQISVQATDNNVETGSLFRDEKGKLLRGNIRKNKNGYLSFLVVSENELLSQIALEEETLLEKLETAKEKVDAGITSLQEQLNKVRDDKVDMDNVLNRMNEIRTALAGAGNNLRDAHQAYDNILKEMIVNRVKPERMSKIREKIIAPLDDIVVNGSYGKAESVFQDAYQLVENEVGAMSKPNVEQHRKNMTEAGTQMEKLSRDIKLVLDAMQEGIVESKLIALLVSIEDEQRRNTEILERIRQNRIREEIEILLGNDKKEKEKK